MGEPSLWNESLKVRQSDLSPWVSTPHGRAVPLELNERQGMGHVRAEVSTPHGRAVPLELAISADALTVSTNGFQPLMGEPSLWNVSFPRVTRRVSVVSTPHGRAVPLELATLEKKCYPKSFRFNPSWESRPSGTIFFSNAITSDSMFQPLMGEPSLWNAPA